MRIGILTFYESDNYGTVLQAYALQEYLKRLGHEVSLINLKRNINSKSSYFSHEKVRKYTIFQRIWNKMILHQHQDDASIKKRKFEDFREKYLNISKEQYITGIEILKDIDKYDIFISGGDQIWNPYHKVFSLDYMCQFLPGNRKRISYGSSFGIDKIHEDEILNQMKKCLSKYRSLMVRESSGVTIIEKMGLKAEQVVDPVFLNINNWSQFVENRSPEKKRYGVIYALVDFPDNDERYIKQYIKKNDLKLIILPENRRNCMNVYAKRFALSPQEFVNYIAHSEVVFTNSFHGLAFAAIFRKRVVLLNTFTQEAKEKQVRLRDLLHSYNAENYGLDCLDKKYKFDYKKMETSILMSQKILEDVLND